MNFSSVLKTLNKLSKVEGTLAQLEQGYRELNSKVNETAAAQLPILSDNEESINKLAEIEATTNRIAINSSDASHSNAEAIQKISRLLKRQQVWLRVLTICLGVNIAVLFASIEPESTDFNNWFRFAHLFLRQIEDAIANDAGFIAIVTATLSTIVGLMRSKDDKVIEQAEQHSTSAKNLAYLSHQDRNVTQALKQDREYPSENMRG